MSLRPSTNASVAAVSPMRAVSVISHTMHSGDAPWDSRECRSNQSARVGADLLFGHQGEEPFCGRTGVDSSCLVINNGDQLARVGKQGLRRAFAHGKRLVGHVLVDHVGAGGDASSSPAWGCSVVPARACSDPAEEFMVGPRREETGSRGSPGTQSRDTSRAICHVS